MSLFGELLKSETEGEEYLDPGIEIISIREMKEILFRKYGSQIADDFLNFAVHSTKPKNLAILKEFFSDRFDYLSEACMKKLEKYNDS